MTILGFVSVESFSAFLMKNFNITCVISKLDITPPLKGYMGLIEAGVFPSISLASLPTAI